MIKKFCLSFVMFVLIFSVVGCVNNEPRALLDIKLIFSETGDVLLTNKNIKSVTAKFDDNSESWFIEFVLDNDGAASLSHVTNISNRGKSIDFIVTENDEELVLISASIYSQINDGVLPIYGSFTEKMAQALAKQIMTGVTD